MPTWKTHIKIAKDLLKKLDLNESDQELFLIGNILPDINNSYVVKDIKVKIEHQKTHYVNDEIPSYKKFYNEYKDKLNNYLVLGYFVHLYIDYFWNNYFYKKYNLNIDKDKLKKMKQNDFLVYANKFIDEKISIKDYDNILINSKLISNINIYKEDLINVVNYFNNLKPTLLKYSILNEKELDILYNNAFVNLQKYINFDIIK